MNQLSLGGAPQLTPPSAARRASSRSVLLISALLLSCLGACESEESVTQEPDQAIVEAIADGLELEFIHCNRYGTAWTLDRHDRKVGEQIQTGKGPSQKQRPGETTREPIDETEELCNVELDDKQMERSRVSSDRMETSSCTKICSSEGGGNIQHEEANAVGYNNATDDGLEVKKIEADAATICVNASVNPAHPPPSHSTHLLFPVSHPSATF